MSRWTLKMWVGDKGKSHRIFTHQSGRLALCDLSGNTPDNTDDGVLWLNTFLPLTYYGESKNSSRPFVNVSLRDIWDKPCSTCWGLAEAIKVSKALNWELRINDLVLSVDEVTEAPTPHKTSMTKVITDGDVQYYDTFSFCADSVCATADISEVIVEIREVKS
ncbi:MAG: hypothetical protein V3V74_07350 [Nitrosomonadaceae bacterium]